ncbi:polysaccharide pyruvyl transferase family protein [Catenovulum sediminis]|uniref:Polysaccharide pyruvyl transferase family protein n=1 Tax=Catenovulum sediminis TaxID=1740262 RepID=A0ABV1RG22_9ALTE|nr:polysaccharide pyruvyl transferase family protein [Catenovulum sediminis]
MQLEYFRAKHNNFGDDLNPWLWEKLIPTNKNSHQVLVGIGTLLRPELVSKLKGKEVHIFSSGAWLNADIQFPDSWKIHAVRGQHTKKCLEVEDVALGDGAYLLPLVDMPPASKMPDICFMPHHESLDLFDWEALCEEIGIGFISPRDDVETVLSQMQGTKKLITEAMHGAIVADVLRIPWFAVSFSPNFEEKKWHDFGSALNLKIKIQPLTFIVNNRKANLKSIAKSIKGSAARLKIGPQKWRKFPWQWFASKQQYQKLINEMQSIAGNENFTLSKESEFTNTCETLASRLDDLIKNHIKNQ